MNEDTQIKLTQIRKILDSSYDKETKKKKDGSGYTVGIISTQEQEDIAWIFRELRRVGEHVIDAKYINPNHIKGKEMDKALAECTFYLYVSSEERWKHQVTPDQKKFTLKTLGKKTLIVLLIDMEDSSDQEKKMIIKNQPGMEKSVRALFLFGKMEKKSEYLVNDGASWRVSNVIQGENSGPQPSNMGNRDQYIPPPYHQLPYAQLPDSKGEFPGPKTPNAGNQERRSPPPYHYPHYTQPPDSRGFLAEASQMPVRRKHVVGIFSRSGERDFAWLVQLLRENFQEYVRDVRHCSISDHSQQKLQEETSLCTFGIIYHTKNRGRVNVTDVTESLYDKELQALSATLGQKNVLVVIDDLEESNDWERERILKTQPSIEKWACDLVLVSCDEKSNNAELVTKLKDLKFILGGEEAQSTPPPAVSPKARKASSVRTKEIIPPIILPTPSRSTVAIFSRSGESDYSWLSHQFSTEDVDVRHYKIPVQNNPEEKAFKCKLVILYHSRKHGKIHLTNVKEALYDEDLETLSAKFGKRKVIVVIDDLEESSDKIKSEILSRQPNVGKFATEIFLFSKEEKKHLGKMGQSKHEKKLVEKISRIKEILKK